MTNDQTVVQIGRKRPVREPTQTAQNLAPTQTAQNLAPPTQNPVSSAPVVLEEGRKAIRIGLLVVSVAFGGGGLLLGRAPLAGAVVASGTVKVTDNHKSVQHLEGGIVKEIRVRNGDRVAAGQTLIVLEDERTTAGLDLLAGQWDAAAAKAARLQAERDFRPEPERDFRPEPAFPERLRARTEDPKVAELLRMETSLFQTKRAALERQLKSADDQVAEIDREQNSLQVQLSAEKEASRLLDEEVRANEAGQRQQVVTKVQVLSLKRAQQERLARQAELGGAIARSRQRMEESRQRMEELRSRAAALRNQYTQAAADELTTVKALLSDLEEKQRPSRDAVNRQAITAPIKPSRRPSPVR